MQRVALFFRLLTWFILRVATSYRWRVLTVLLGVGLGAAVFTSVRLSVNASLSSFSNSMDLIAGKADWTVFHPGGRVPDSLVPRLLALPFIETVSPLLTTYVHPEADDAEPFLLIGMDPILDLPLRSWRIERAESNNPSRTMDLLSEPGALLLSRRLAGLYGMKPDDRLTLEHVRNKQDFRVIGELAPQGLALVEGGRIAVADISSMQEFTGLIGYVDRIDILLRPSATKEDLERIRSVLPPEAVLERPSETKQSGAMMIRSYQLNLSILSFVSLFVGMFLVYSLIALNARSRRNELAILRSIGASSRMLFLLFLMEGALFGVFGWLIALPISTFLVRYLLVGVSRTISNLFVRVSVDRLQLDPWEIILSFVVTVFVSVVAAYQPAREAMSVSPREAMDVHGGGSKSGTSPRNLALAGVLLIAGVWPVSESPAIPELPLPGYIATFLLFSGFSLLSPWCLQLTGTYLPPFLRRLWGEPAYLAGRYVRDAGVRTAISVGALITAMALFVALAVMVHSFRGTVETWTNQSISGDLFMRANMSEINQYRDPVPEEVITELEKLGDRVNLLPYRRIPLRYGEHPYHFEAIDFEVFERLSNFLFVEGGPAEAMEKLARGDGVLVSEVFANKTGLGVGDLYKAQVEGIDLDLPILGIARDYRTQGGVVWFSLRDLEALTGERTWSGVRIFVADRDQDVAAETARLRNELLRSFAERYAVGVITGSELRGEIMRIFDETFAITTVLLLIALLVAALGITTTLTVLVLERKRQLNTLLAIGAGFDQIRSMILWESLLMVGVGEVVGLACGFMLSYILIYVVNRQSFGWTFIYDADWSSVLVSLPLILATALLAAFPAIRLVFRYSPAMALRE
jgi:putative ABC transport system permease protein